MSFIPCYKKVSEPEYSPKHLSQRVELLRTFQKESEGFLSVLSTMKWYLTRSLPIDPETFDQGVKSEEQLYNLRLSCITPVREIIYERIQKRLPVQGSIDSLPSYMLKEKNSAVGEIDDMIIEILRVRTSLQNEMLDELLKRML